MARVRTHRKLKRTSRRSIVTPTAAQPAVWRSSPSMTIVAYAAGFLLVAIVLGLVSVWVGVCSCWAALSAPSLLCRSRSRRTFDRQSD